MTTASFTITPQDDGIRMTGGHITQNLEFRLELGQSYTLSVESGSTATDTEVSSATFTVPSNPGDNWYKILSVGGSLFSATISYAPDLGFSLTFNISGAVNIKWVKLEPGTVATKFVPPDPATELLKCQRYYIAFNENAPFSGWIFSATSARITIPVPTAMREAPTLVFPDGGSIGSTRIYSNGGTLTPSAYSVQQAANNQIVLSLTVAGATANQTAAWRSISKAALDAEI